MTDTTRHPSPAPRPPVQSRLMDLARAGRVHQLQHEAGLIALEAGYGLMGTGTQSWTKLYSECSMHLQFKRSAGLQKLEPLVEAFLRALPRSEADLRLRALNRKRRELVAERTKIQDQLDALDREIEQTAACDLFGQGVIA